MPMGDYSMDLAITSMESGRRKERKHKGLGNYPMVTESPKRDYLR